MAFKTLLFASTALAAFSPEQMSFVFQSTKGLRGASFKAPGSYDFTLVANTTHALCALQIVDGGLPGASASDVGWIGIGGGAAMIGSDDLIFWQSPKGDWIVSRREPNLQTLSAMKDPGDAGASTDGDFALVPELSSGKGAKVAQVAFIRKLKPSYKSKSKFQTWKLAKNQPFVFARSSTAPDASGNDATLAYHDVNQGSFTLDLTAAVKATRNFGTGSVLSVKLPTVDASAVPSPSKASALTPSSKSKTSKGRQEASKQTTTKTIANDRETTNKKNATVTSTAYDPNDTPDFCDLLAAKNASASGPCAQRTIEKVPKKTTSSSSLAALATPSLENSGLSAANATSSQDEFSSSSTLQLSILLMSLPIFVMLL